MPAWKAQLETLRTTNPLRASYHALCLYLGTRPGELARAKWSEIDAERRVPHARIPAHPEQVRERQRVNTKPSYLSREGLEKLRHELEEMTNVRRHYGTKRKHRIAAEKFKEVGDDLARYVLGVDDDFERVLA